MDEPLPPDVIVVDDPDDPRIAAFRNIRDRDLRGGHGGAFVAEGESVLKVLLASPHMATRALLVAENRLDRALDLAAGRCIPIFLARQTVMDAIVGFPIHRGLLGIGERPPPATPAQLLSGHPLLTVGLCGIANHDNVGGIFRNMAAFGVSAALVDKASADPFYRKALRVSVGGVLKVPFATVDSEADILGAFLAGGYRVLALSPGGRQPLEAVRIPGPTALLLGSEGPGLATETLARVETVSIPMSGGFDSLNVATTAGIALWALNRAAATGGPQAG